MGEPSKLESAVGIRHADLTKEERDAVDRIKDRFHDLNQRERDGSGSDIIMDRSVAIAAELRRARGAS